MNTLKTTKICPKCQVERPVSEFSKSKYTKDGLQTCCKACNKAYYQRNKEKITGYYQINKERIAEYYQTNKEIKSEYYKKNKERILKVNKEYQEENKERILKTHKKYYYKNKEKILEYQSAYFNTDKGKALRKKYTERFNEKNPGYRKAYRQTPAGKAANKKGNHKYRSLKAGVTVENFSPVEVFERDGYRCQLCGKKTRPDFKNHNHPLYPNLDHLIPLSKGGEHSKLNTQCLCHQCNMEKRNREDFGDQQRLFG